MLFYSHIATVCLVYIICESSTKPIRRRAIAVMGNYNELIKPTQIKTGKLIKRLGEEEYIIPLVEQHEGSYDELYSLKPDWKVKSSKSKSYFYEGFIPNEDANIDGFGDSKLSRNHKSEAVNLKITQKQITCVHTVQDEIANLFYDDFDVSKKNVPLCCKTEVKCQPKTTKCMKESKTTPKCTQTKQMSVKKLNKTTFNQLKNLIPLQTTTVHHSVSQEAVVNVVIHVKCDHSEVQNHALPNTISINPYLSCGSTNRVQNANVGASTKYFSFSFFNLETTEISKYSNLQFGVNTKETETLKQPSVKKYETAKEISPNICDNGKDTNDQTSNKKDENAQCCPNFKFPRPLLPHDITIKITQPTFKPRTLVLPGFLCKMTSKMTNKSTTNLSAGRPNSFKPGFTLGLQKKIKLPNFLQRKAKTENKNCLKTTELTCKNKETTELNVLERVSCLPDAEKSEDSCNSNTDDNSNMDFLTPGTDFNLNRPEYENSFTETYQTVLERVGLGTLKEENQSPTEIDLSSSEEDQHTDMQSHEENFSDRPNKEPGQGIEEQFHEPTEQTVTDNDGLFSTQSFEYKGIPTPDVQNTISKQESSTEFPKSSTELNLATFSVSEQILENSIPEIPSTDFDFPSYDGAKGNNPISQEISSSDNNLEITVHREATFKTSDETNIELGSSTSVSASKYIENESTPNELFKSFSEPAENILTVFNAETQMNTEISDGTVLRHSTSPMTVSNELSSQTGSSMTTESAFSYKSHENSVVENYSQLDTTNSVIFSVGHETTKETTKDFENIIELNNSSFLFYHDHKWFITNKKRLWSFDEGMVEILNDTLFTISREHSMDQTEKNEEYIKQILYENGNYNTSEEVPFAVFVQAVLLYSKYSHDMSRSFEWLGINLNLNELLAMLRVSNFDSLTETEWESVDWLGIYRMVKESNKVTSEGKYELMINEPDGSKHSLVIFSNGSSIWKSVEFDLNETLNTIESKNSKIYFSNKLVNNPYYSNDLSFTLFLKSVFLLRKNSNVMFSEYSWGAISFSWNELLALILMINTTLAEMKNLDNALLQHIEGLLVQFRSSTKRYFTDRTVYDINFGKEVKTMTVFLNGTTNFDGNVFNLDGITEMISNIPLSEDTKVDVQHVINLGGKLQFYRHGKWYITDNIRIWSLEEQTIALVNDSFFSLPEDTTARRDNIEQLFIESSYSNQFEMPFELFAQSILKATQYSVENIYHWSGCLVSYGDILAILRLSSFDTFNPQISGISWGQFNWYLMYDVVKQSPNLISPEKQAYQITDFDSYVYPLIVFSNGTSIWKHYKLDLAESLERLQALNSEAYFPDVIMITSYISTSDSFLLFITDAILDRLNNKIVHSFYNFKEYKFKWEDLVAINRVLLHYYESKTDSDLSFSKIALPILSYMKKNYPDKTVYEVKIGSEAMPLTVYLNGTTEFNNIVLEFVDTVKRVEELKKSSNMVFKEDWGGGEITLKDVHSNGVDMGSHSTDNVHIYDWKQLNNNPFLNVCYPINLGGGKVQFYMKNTWFVTDGISIWPFENPLTNFYINDMVKSMSQTFNDDPHLNKLTVQELVDSKHFHQGSEELVMPHELLVHHFLFFMKHLKQEVALNISRDVVYHRENQLITSIHLLMSLRLSAFNHFSTPEVELPWEKGKILNWDWFILMGKRSERMDEGSNALNTSYFEEYQHTPLLVVYSNFSSDWGSQHLDLDEALLKVQKANDHFTFLPVEVKGEFASKSDTFEGFYKEALNKRFEKQMKYSKYKWSTDVLSWFDILIAVRYPEVQSEAIRDNMFWKNVVKGINRALKSKYSDRVEYEISGIDPSKEVKVTVCMNESTVFNGKIMDIEEYKTLL